MPQPFVMTNTEDVPVGTSTNLFQTNDAAVVALLQSILIGQGSLVVQPLGGTLAAAASGTIYSNEGATVISPFVLPTAVAGLRYGFAVQDADGIRVTAAAGDTIQIAGTVSGVAGKVESTTTGSYIYLFAINATEWFSFQVVGTWTVT